MIIKGGKIYGLFVGVLLLLLSTAGCGGGSSGGGGDSSGSVTTLQPTGIIFEDNFDSHADWSPEQLTSAIECTSDLCTTAPSGYSAYRIAALESCSEAGKNTININSAQPRGGSGKSFLFWNEPCPSSGGSWGSDGDLKVSLPSDYDELYVRFYIKFQSGWQWNTSSPMQKFFRISHYWGGNDFLNFAGGNNHPIWVADLAKWNSGTSDIAYVAAYRYENTYYPSSATPGHSSSDTFYFPPDGNYGGTGIDFWDTGMMGDGGWHSWEFYVKLNSAVGVPDGITRFWQDGVLIAETTDLAWSDEGSQQSPRIGWNTVMLGGNNYNYYSGGEQWYAMDDLVISTSYIGPD